MKNLRFPALLALALVSASVGGAATTGCGVPAKTVLDVSLTGAQYACVLLTSLWDAPAIAAACGIAEKLIPAIRQVMVGKALAAKSQGAALPPEARPYLDEGLAEDAGKE